MTDYKEWSRQHNLNQRSRNAMALLRELNFRFHVDFDNSLIVDAPEYINPQQVVALLMKGEQGVVHRILDEQRRHRRVLHGGPLHGRKGVSGQPAFGTRLAEEPMWYFHHLERKRWAVYRIEPDGRGFFVKEVTSKQNAKYLVQRLAEGWRDEYAAEKELEREGGDD